MNERRNALITALLIVTGIWAIFSWVIAPDHFDDWMYPSVNVHQYLSLGALVALGIALYCAYTLEDPLVDQLSRVTGGEYFEMDGLCFMPLVRCNPTTHQAEISLYYQNRFSHSVDTVIHLHPVEPVFASHRGATEVPFSFIAQPGAFGVVHQPIAVAPNARGQTVDVKVAAAVRWTTGKGDELRRHVGNPCGTMNIDWVSAFRVGEHELTGEMKMTDPATIHLAMPLDASARVEHTLSTQETLFAPSLSST